MSPQPKSVSFVGEKEGMESRVHGKGSLRLVNVERQVTIASGEMYPESGILSRESAR